VWVAAFFSQGSGPQNTKAWFFAFGAAALSMALIAVFHAYKLPYFEVLEGTRRSIKQALQVYVQAFRSYLAQRQVARILVFIILYKVGDGLMFSMVTPFLMRELGLSKDQYVIVASIVGAVGAICGALWGAAWIKRTGLRRAIWPLTFIMNAAIWLYIGLAYFKPASQTLQGLSIIAAVHGLEQLAAGLGSAALLIYLLGTCKPDYKAAHYAVGSALMTLPATFIGGFLGGRIVEKLGYLSLFALAFAASLPVLFMIPWVPYQEQETKG
jgi:PAT family beta-lactamase induction signal transducer AmpG